MSDFPREIMMRCLKNDAYLNSIKKALLFDEDNLGCFQNTYDEMLDELIKENWAIHRIAESLSVQEFHRILKDKE